MVLALLALGATSGASAQDSELRLFAEPISYTDVADAFDEQDAFDLNVTLGYRRSLTTGTIQREINGDAVRDGRGSANFIDIAEHRHLRNVLELGLEAGLFHDLAFFARLPIVLSDDRELQSLDSADGRLAANTVLLTRDPGGADVPLFNTAFQAPTRSGLEEVELGLAWSVFNQHREPEVPTWVLRVSGQFSIGEPMHACHESEDYGDDAATPSPENWRCNVAQDAGISQGTNGLHLETRTSWRLRYIEPFAGLSFQIGWPGSSDDLFSPGGDLSGFMNTIPPLVGEMTAGAAIVPWEHRSRWQRFVVDLRLTGTYISEGHGYSPLFDALGTSDSEYLRTPNQECPGCARQVPFTGLTDMESHGRIGGHLALEMQAAKYVKFVAGGSLYYTTPYVITFADACNPNVDPDGASDPRQGTCRSGIINPHHRSVIDLPGSRFRVNGELTFDLSASAVAQF